jgi:hypothetical protein
MSLFVQQLKDAFLKNLYICNSSFCLSLATQIQRNTGTHLNNLVVNGNSIPEWLLKVNAHGFTVRQFLDHGLSPHALVSNCFGELQPIPWIEAAARFNQPAVVFELLRFGADPEQITQPVLDPAISMYLAMYTPSDLMPLCMLAVLPSIGITEAQGLLLWRIRLNPSHFSFQHILSLTTSFVVHSDLRTTLRTALTFSFRHANLFVRERSEECTQLALVMYRRGIPNDIFLHTLRYVSR